MSKKKAPASGAKDSKAKYPTPQDFARVNAAALACLESVCNHFAPGGKKSGREYLTLNPRRPDEHTGSFSINLDSGKWADFAEDASGGDPVSLVSYILGAAHQSEGLRELAAFLGIPATEGEPTPDPGAGTAAPPFKLKAREPEARPVMPIPADAMATKPQAHPSHGRPSQVWPYLDENGGLLFEVHRYDPPGARKQFSPLSYWPDGTWKFKGAPAPRPLYGRDRLAARPNAPVILCEGEKAADAAGWLMPDHVAITTPNGAGSPEKADLSPLKGRIVRIWLDNDEPGAKYAKTCTRRALEAGAASVEILDLRPLAIIPTTGEACELPKGWDAADALARGWNPETLAARLKWKPARVKTPTPQAADPEPPGPASAGGAELPHGYEIIEPGDHSRREPGVYFTQPKNRTADGPDCGPHVTSERFWLSSVMRVTAEARDHGGHEWTKVLELRDPDGILHRLLIPRAMLAGTGEAARALVHAHGGEVSTGAEQQRRWRDYLMKSRPQQRERITSKSGWHPGGVFVLGNSRTFAADSAEPVIFAADGAEPPDFAARGTLEEWQANIGAPAIGNSRLTFGLSMVFAGPLMDLTGDEPGGFHLKGKEFQASSSGKTTLQKAAVSVMGGPSLLKRWRATANSLEGVAESFNGLALILDEISQLDAREAAGAIYGLGNGQGKIRAGRGGEPKPPKTWNLLFLSSGEISLEEHLKSADRQYRAGLGARLVEIEADAGKGLGCFEELHGSPDPAHFARRLQAAAAKYYGTPLVHWLEWLTANREEITARIAEWRPGALAQLLANHADPSGLVRRVADRFTLVGIAGELAIECGVLPWPRGTAWQAAARLFAEWIAQRGGAGNVEAVALVDRVRNWLLMNAEARFTDLYRANDIHAPRTFERCGFFARHHVKAENPADETIIKPNPATIDETDELTGETKRHVLTRSQFMVFPQAFKDEIIGGADVREAERLLTAAGILRPGNDRPTRKIRLPGFKNPQRVYLLSLDYNTEGAKP